MSSTSNNRLCHCFGLPFSPGIACERMPHDGGVGAALAHLHGFQPPVVHLDLKPGNILIHKLAGGSCTASGCR
eukprot:326083-Amphidinium_carterae.1